MNDPQRHADRLVSQIDPDPTLARALLHSLVNRLADAEEWLTPGEFAKVTGIHLNSVTNWARAGRIRHTTYPSGRLRGIHASEVERMVKMTPNVPEESLRLAARDVRVKFPNASHSGRNATR